MPFSKLGLAPEFTVDLNAKNNVVQYKIVADDKMLNDQVASIQKQYGKLIAKDTVEAGDDVSGIFANEEKGINNRTTLAIDAFADKKTQKAFSYKNNRIGL